MNSLPGSLVIGRLRVVDGVRQEDPLTVGVFEPRSFLRRHEPGALFVLIDLLADTPDDDVLLGELMSVARQTYERTPGSITRRLRQVIVTVNRHLRSWNGERKNGRQAAGISCVALVGNEVYLAQAGPALAFIAQPGAVERYPESSPWLSEVPLESMPGGIWTPLGIRDGLYVDLNFAEIAPGYTLLLTSAHLPQLLIEDEVALLLDQDPEDVLRDLALIPPSQDLSALVIGLVEPEPVEEPPASEPSPESSGPGMGQRMMMAGRRGMVALGSAGAAALGGVAGILESTLPERGGDESEEPPARRRQIFMWLAIVIPIVLVLLTLAIYWTRGLDREVRIRNLLESASAEVEQARALAETDPARAQELLQAASSNLDRVSDLQPGDGAVEQLRADIRSQLDRIEGVDYVLEVIPVASLPGTIDDRRRLVIQGTSAFVFNAREQVVHRIGLGDRRIFEALRTDGVYGGRTVGPLVDMAWVPAGGVRQQSAIVALDSTGTAWQIDALGNVTPLNVADADTWQGLRLVGGFAGNLYVLDVSLGQILKYSPTVDGYAVPPVVWLSPEAEVALDSAVDIAIDGSIYLLQSDGRVEKLVAGEPVPFDQPDEFDLSQPVACFATPPSGTMFLADTTRVLQFDAAGIFQRQLLPPDGPWQRLSALWVDEANGWLYTVDAGTLVRAALPARSRQ